MAPCNGLRRAGDEDKGSSPPSHGQDVAWARDDTAASPLVVLTTFVIVAVLVTVVIYALAFDRPVAGVSLVAVKEDGSLAFDVTKTSGGLDWTEVTLRFLDRAGTDLSSPYLQVPDGSIDVEDRVAVTPLPPAGTYLLLVFKGDTELSRLAVTV
jgi:hypothetical protein